MGCAYFQNVLCLLKMNFGHIINIKSGSLEPISQKRSHRCFLSWHRCQKDRWQQNRWTPLNGDIFYLNGRLLDWLELRQRETIRDLRHWIVQWRQSEVTWMGLRGDINGEYWKYIDLCLLSQHGNCVYVWFRYIAHSGSIVFGLYLVGSKMCTRVYVLKYRS